MLGVARFAAPRGLLCVFPEVEACGGDSRVAVVFHGRMIIWDHFLKNQGFIGVVEIIEACA